MTIYTYDNDTEHDVTLQIWTGERWTEGMFSDLEPLTEYRDEWGNVTITQAQFDELITWWQATVDEANEHEWTEAFAAWWEDYDDPEAYIYFEAK